MYDTQSTVSLVRIFRNMLREGHVFFKENAKVILLFRRLNLHLVELVFTLGVLFSVMHHSALAYIVGHLVLDSPCSGSIFQILLELNPVLLRVHLCKELCVIREDGPGTNWFAGMLHVALLQKGNCIFPSVARLEYE